MAARRADYFAAGTLVVWGVDVLQAQLVRVYRVENPSMPTVYRRGQHAEAEPALPGWSMPVDDLFPVFFGVGGLRTERTDERPLPSARLKRAVRVV
jgi:Uma2 family endonuclease